MHRQTALARSVVPAAQDAANSTASAGTPGPTFPEKRRNLPALHASPLPHQTKYRSDAAPIVEHAVGSVPGLEARDGSEQPAELNLDEIVGGLSHELLHGVVHARCVAMGIGVEFRCHRTWQNLRCAQVEWLAVSKSPRRRSDLVQVPASQGWSSVGDSSHCLNGRVRCGRSIGQQNDALLPGADFHPGFTAYGCQVLQALARAGCNRPRCQCLVGAVQTHLVTCSVR